MRKSLDLTDRVAVVGATSGLGRTIAAGLAEYGADVIPTGRRPEHVESACRQIRAYGRRALCRTVDVRRRESIVELRDAVLDSFGRVDILVNAAGYTFQHPTATMCEERWSPLLDTNQGQRPGPCHQHRFAGLVSGVSRSGGVLRGFSRLR